MRRSRSSAREGHAFGLCKRGVKWVCGIGQTAQPVIALQRDVGQRGGLNLTAQSASAPKRNRMGATYHLMFRGVVASDTMDPSSRTRRVLVIRERVARDTDRGASGGTATARHCETSFVLVDRHKMPSKVVFAREGAVACLVRAHVGLEAVGVVSRYVSLEIERAGKRCKKEQGQ